MAKVLAASMNGEMLEDLAPVQHFTDRTHDFDERSIYEALQVYNDQLFEFNLHAHRMLNSAHLMNLELSLEEVEQIHEWCQEIIPEVRESVFLLLVAVTPEDIVIIAYPLDINQPDPKRSYSTKTYRIDRPTPEAKSMLARGIAAGPLQEARDLGFDEALLVDEEGNITEGAVTNVWWERGGKLHTNVDKALPGTTQMLLLDLAEQMGIEVIVEEQLKVADLEKLDGLAVSSVRAGFRPVRSVDVDGKNVDMKALAELPLMEQLFNRFHEYILEQCPVFETA